MDENTRTDNLAQVVGLLHVLQSAWIQILDLSIFLFVPLCSVQWDLSFRQWEALVRFKMESEAKYLAALIIATNNVKKTA